MSTIYDIAKQVGLSPSTVARALSGKGYCSPDARAQIMKIAKEMRYVPVQAAKSLKSKITHKIMLCIPDIMNPYYFSMINEVNRVLEEYQYYTILVYTNHDAKKELNMVKSLRERFVDGLIMVSFDFSDTLLQAIYDVGLPVVLTNAYKETQSKRQLDCVYVDHTKATFLAAEHCIENGHRRIAFLCGNVSEQTGFERLAGYKMALEQAELPFDEELVVQADYTLEGGRAAFEEFLARGTSFTAVVCCNDLMGIACINACKASNLKAGGDYSIVTLDNTDYCLCTTPLLSSVDMMQDQIGQNAAQFIMEQIQGGRDYGKKMTLTPRLVCRDSVVKLGERK